VCETSSGGHRDFVEGGQVCVAGKKKWGGPLVQKDKSEGIHPDAKTRGKLGWVGV